MMLIASWTVAAALLAAWAGAWWVLAARLHAVARACHEIRGPLGAARLGLQFGERRGGLTADRLRAIDHELGRAALALEDLTVLHRLRDVRRWPVPDGSRSVTAPEVLDLEEVVAHSVAAWRAAALARGVEVRLDWGADVPRVFGNRLRLAQAVGNLLANAIAHGGGRLEVRGRRSRELVRVEVLDDGPGLPAPVASLVRRGRRRRSAHGHGLAVAAAVAEAHGGRLASAPSQRGARLVLELPVAQRGNAALEGA